MRDGTSGDRRRVDRRGGPTVVFSGEISSEKNDPSNLHRIPRTEAASVNEYILFMHADADASKIPEEAWAQYLSTLRASGALEGGSAIGGGVAMSKHRKTTLITDHITGYIRVRAANLDDACGLVAANPV
jgi:hypothetical protein